MKSKRRFLTLFVSAVALLVIHAEAFAQSEPTEPTYEVSLHVVIGSNSPGRSALPTNLSAISSQIKSNFQFENYQLANTFLSRFSNTGNIEYKSVSNILGQETDGELPTFLDWSFGNVRATQNGFQARTFRFGVRIPVRTAASRDDKGNVIPVLNYEGVGLTVHLLGLPLDKPALIGTISLPKTTGTIFLIATIKRVQG